MYMYVYDWNGVSTCGCMHTTAQSVENNSVERVLETEPGFPSSGRKRL